MKCVRVRTCVTAGAAVAQKDDATAEILEKPHAGTVRGFVLCLREGVFFLCGCGCVSLPLCGDCLRDMDAHALAFG